MTDTQTLLLVDGSSYLFRAYHALPDLRNKAGEPTGAIHGMVGMLRRLRDDTRLHGGATLGAVIFDAPGRTFRDDLYEHYKANRSQTPEALVAQIAPIHELTQALGWPLLVVPGIEADDVIGTLATRARAAGMRTVISTGDKDLAQLVDDETLLVNTMTRDGVPPTVMDAAGVRDKFGVDPGQIIDFLTLTGDAVDNVPGVDKVGPKTAAKWLNEYGSLEVNAAPDVYAMHQGEGADLQVMKYAQALRAQGFNVMQHSGYQSLKAQMKKADNSGARFALIVAQDELANGTVTLKDMNGAHGQQTVAADDLIHTLQQWKNA